MSIEILKNQFEADGFKVVSNDSYVQLTIEPNLLVENDALVKAVVMRESADSLPESIVLRYSQSKRIPSKTLEIYFAFSSKPSPSILSICKLYSVGILYIDVSNSYQCYAESKQIKSRKKNVSLPKLQIFFSSRQYLEERKDADLVISDQRDSLKVPIFSMLVENDQKYSNDIRKLWPIIERCMDECDYVLIILSGEYRRIIDRETRRALDLYDPDELLFYVKSEKETKDAWEDLLLCATQHAVKYTEYYDIRDFKLKFNARLMKIIHRAHKKYGVPFLGDDL